MRSRWRLDKVACSFACVTLTTASSARFFQRLERWHNRDNGCADMQQAPYGAREDRRRKNIATSRRAMGELPLRLMGTVRLLEQAVGTSFSSAVQVPQVHVVAAVSAPTIKDFWEDELRGYRLLKAARVDEDNQFNRAWVDHACPSYNGCSFQRFPFVVQLEVHSLIRKGSVKATRRPGITWYWWEDSPTVRMVWIHDFRNSGVLE